MQSLRARLLVAWVLSLAAALGVGAVLVQLYRQSSAAQSGLSAAVLEQGCAAIAENYTFYVAGWAGPRGGREEAGFRRDLAAVVGLAMAGRAGQEAGIWRVAVAGAGEVEAPGGEAPGGEAPGGEAPGGEALAQQPAADIRPLLAAAAAAAWRNDEVIGFGAPGGRHGLACPLDGPVPGMVAWVAHLVPAAPGYREVQVGLGVLLALVLLTAGWLSALLLAWSHRIRLIEAALVGHERAGDGGALGAVLLPRVAATGERELDRIVTALNTAGERLAEARARSAELSAQVAAAERLAALGRVAAGVAHEIRNPIAAMRLRAENALAGDPARRAVALEAILEQVARLDRLSGELLAMTQRRTPEPAPVDVVALLHACAAEQEARQQEGGRGEGGLVRVAVDAPAPALCGLLDAALIRRILDNLVQNAVRHTPPGGLVMLSAVVVGDRLRLTVADSGPGVPAVLRGSLFEPFVTGRPDGTGLGLAIARELAEVQGGSLVLRESESEGGRGAVFVLEVPWHAC